MKHSNNEDAKIEKIVTYLVRGGITVQLNKIKRSLKSRLSRKIGSGLLYSNTRLY